ncbi:FxsA family protein [Marinospirillum alkaliphilum]|uniref:UPF0716 protein FxsA n=1 Tax=Marinospirillum alkaliphilum DSM 21637 TaxID=1122209 RepID=A0A1K1YKK3_9GAMM|nr:FxsA family protein [Marinospirillum alkaliphilum]SFX61981.1 UPF0716 protein FxsA [Marinospirillum alkaliphilum DSM 21637]
MPYLFALLLWPLAEIWLLIKVGQQAGALNTLLLIIATAALGLLLVQLEWQRLMLLLREKLHQGEEPVGVLLETAAVGLAGVLLFIPGFISDWFGLLLLLPLTRKWLTAPLKKMRGNTTYHYRSDHYSSQQQDTPSEAGKVLEGEYQRKDDQRP